MAKRGKYRLRSWIRRNSPWFLIDRGFAARPNKDCGMHEWFNSDDMTYCCYHCKVGKKSAADVTNEWEQSGSGN
jgi:hypothetical protein